MSPIAPHRVASPILLGGMHAASFLPLAAQLGFTGAQLFSEKLGAASAAKMCRSVVIKGLEALMLESLLTARKFGVEQAVLDSLQSSSPADSWRTQGRYMISRALVHGRRRAEEMREAARTVAEAGLAPRMSGACAEWQEWAADHSAAANEGLEQMLDTLLDAGARSGDMLIIDCHGHYTTAPEPHQKFRDAQLVRIKDSTLAGAGRRSESATMRSARLSKPISCGCNASAAPI